ncbi:YtxH domain-containing protein [Vagococcus carniphilus]|uniref:YtxH domain-containing protein n=1 Tax=Vagococcus carniphilus TaxID=218144 RepID=A0AAW8U1G3_9ENTE|nr:YtxH domain-containing protein [Vagococcus carniphilus]MDT2815635.1 YtxH domain-containing protein [Vagococcus carniphilus]MDT2831184.1 YtxH domain-containing protein [Vagococcus carniphilus]MDT2833368.1 YtxH domain-containing protein [Vagococcus carniphilus]MDT2839657.1 YtxH domain-containing protein [Vagococcus carniphilus]MDT2854126.1 YtxH domain-containing protein [Vagococcus carniphilus]
MDKKKFSGKKFVKGLVIGGIIGGSAALLLAPRSGKETRKKIQDEIDDTFQLIMDVKNGAEEVQSNTSQLQEIAENLIPDFIEGTEKSLERFKFKSKYRLEDIKKQLAKIETEINDFSNSLNE